MTGSQELINYAMALARNPYIDGYLHWGRRNDYLPGGTGEPLWRQRWHAA